MKFKLIPTAIIELFSYRNTKDKTKAVWVSATWGFINWLEYEHDATELFEDCKTIKEVQLKLDTTLKKAVPVSKDENHIMHDDYKEFDEDDVYDIKQIADALSMEEDEFINDDSGGFATNQVFKWENVTEQEKEKVSSIPDDEDENKKVTLSDAAEGNMNEWLDDFGYESDNGVTLYRLPLKVVAVEEEPKTKAKKISNQLGIQHSALLERLEQAVNSKVRKKKEAVIKKELLKKWKRKDIILLIKHCQKKYFSDKKNYIKQLKFLEKLKSKDFKE